MNKKIILFIIFTFCFAGILMQSEFFNSNFSLSSALNKTQEVVQTENGIKPNVEFMANTATEAIFYNQNKKTNHTSLEEAISLGGTVVLLQDFTLTENLTIPSNATFLIPFADASGLFTKTYKESQNGDSQPYASFNSTTNYCYKKLTVPNGITITVEGTLVIGGVYGNKNTGPQGITSGNYGQIDNNGTINVSSNGMLTVYGYLSGNGFVNVNSGATLKEVFVLNDYAGGTNTTELYKNKIFPFEQFTLMNITNTLTINYNANVIGMGNIYASKFYTNEEATIIGNGGLAKLTNPNSKIVVKNTSKYVLYENTTSSRKLSDTKEKIIQIYGGADAGKFSLGSYSSDGMYLPLPYNFNVQLFDGNYTLPAGNMYKLLPGCKFYVAENANVDLNGEVLVCDAYYSSDMSGRKYPTAERLIEGGFSPNGVLIIDGTLNINGTFSGTIQTTNLNATINVSDNAILGGERKSGGTTAYDCNVQVANYGAKIRGGCNTLENLETGKTYKVLNLDKWSLGDVTIRYATNTTDTSIATDNSINSPGIDNLFQSVAPSYHYWETITLSFNDNDYSGVWCDVHDHSYSIGELIQPTPTTTGKAIYNCASKFCPNIEKTLIYVPSLENSSLTYNETAQTVVINNLNSEYMTLDGNLTYTSSGTYSVTISLKEKENCQWAHTIPNSDDLTLSWTINKSVINVPKYETSYEYNNGPVNPVESHSGMNIKFYQIDELGNETEINEPSASGNYKVKFSLKNNDYIWSDTTQTDKVFEYSIVKRNITIVIDSLTTEYNQELLDLTYTINGDFAKNESIIDLNFVINKEEGLIAGEYPITGTYNNPNYNVTIVPGIYTISKAQGHIYATSQTYTYDKTEHFIVGATSKTNQEISYTNNGLIAADSKQVIVTALENDCYAKATIIVTLTVLKRDIDIKIDNKSTIYGQALDEKYTYIATNTIEGDNLQLSFSKEEGLNVGTYNITGQCLNTNYNATFVNGTYTITPAQGHLSVEDLIVEYDGTEHKIVGSSNTNQTITYSNNNSLTNVGEVKVTVTAQAGNYTEVTKEVSLKVTERKVTITIDNKTSVYGEEILEYTSRITSGSIIDGDNINLVLTRENNLNVGTYDIVGSYENSNYNITFINGIYTITNASFKNIIFENKTITYDGLSHTINVQNIPEGANVTYVGEFKFSQVGTYKITVNVSMSNFESQNLSANLIIEAKKITITIDNKTSEYGEDILEYTSRITSGSIIEGDNINLILTKEEGLNVGTYNIVGSYNNSNYDITFINGTYIITSAQGHLNVEDLIVEYDGTEHKIVASSNTNQTIIYSNNNSLTNVGEVKVTVTAQAGNYTEVVKEVTLKVYARLLEVTIDNKTSVYGEEFEYLSYTTKNEIVGDKLDIILSWEQNSNAGTYIITGTCLNKNYDAKFNEAYYVITKAKGQISATNQTYTYNGTNHSITNYYSTSGQQISCLSDNSLINVGGQNVTFVALENDNYFEESVTVLLKIIPSYILIEVDDKKSVYGENIKDLTYSIKEGQIYNNDDLNIQLNIEEHDSYNAGTYRINGTYNNNNYDAKIVSGQYLILKADGVIIAESASFEYDGKEHKLLATTTSEQTIKYDNNSRTNVGETVVTLSVDETENYKAKTINLTISIYPRKVNVVIDNKDSIYNQNLVELTFQIPQNIVEGDNLNIVLHKEDGITPGQYTISGICNNKNYEASFENGTYTINKISTIITLGATVNTNKIEEYNVFVTYTGEEISLTALANGNRNVLINYTDSLLRVDAGEYKAKISILENDYYLGLEVDANLIIEKKLYEYSLNNVNKDYNGFAISKAEVIPFDFLYGYNIKITNNSNEVNEILNAGVYTIFVEVNDKNYYGNWEFTYTINKINWAVDVNNINNNLIINSSNIKLPNIEDLYYSVDNKNYISTTKISNLNPMTKYILYIKKYADLNHNELILEIDFTTTRSINDIINILNMIPNTVSINNFEDIKKIENYSKEISEEDKQNLDLTRYEKIVEDYNNLVKNINNDAKDAIKVANNFIKEIINIVSTVSALGVALVLLKKKIIKL